MTYYVLLELGWEYNDEYYSRSENDGGRPRKVFTNKKEAEKERKIKSYERVKDGEIEYLLECYSNNDREEIEEFKLRFPCIAANTKISNLPEDIKENFMSFLEEKDICFYEIVECNS